MHQGDLYKKLIYSLEEKMLPELLSLSEELGVACELVLGFYVESGKLRYMLDRYGSIEVTTRITDFHLDNTDCIIKYTPQIYSVSQATYDNIKKLKEMKKEILNMIYFEATYKKQIIIEKIKK